MAYAPPSPSSTETSVAIWTNSTRRMGGARVPAIKSSSFVAGPALRELRYCQESYCREVVGYLIPEWMRFTKPRRQHRTLDIVEPIDIAEQILYTYSMKQKINSIEIAEYTIEC